MRRPFLGPALALAAALVALTPAAAAPTLDASVMPAGTYVLDKAHASLLVRVRHMGLSRYTMRFDRFDADFDYDPAAPQNAKVKVTIDARSLDNGSKITSRLFADQFLDAGKNPTITFNSTQLQIAPDGKGTLAGDLTLRGVTHPVTFDVAFDGYQEGGLLGRRAGFSAVGQIDRTDFGSTALAPDSVGKEVEFIIEAEFVRK
jgi:polyisoprenoid-binding protein YceI